MAFSPATTMGDEEGRGSAIYFIDNCISFHRLTDMSRTKGSNYQKHIEKVMRRNHYLNKINESSQNRSVSVATIQEVEKWITTSKLSKVAVNEKLSQLHHAWDGI